MIIFTIQRVTLCVYYTKGDGISTPRVPGNTIDMYQLPVGRLFMFSTGFDMNQFVLNYHIIIILIKQRQLN